MAASLPHQIDVVEVKSDLSAIRSYGVKLRRAADALAAPVLPVAEEIKTPEETRVELALEIGKPVWVLTLRREGELVDLGPKRATVVIGGKRLQVPVDQVKALEPKDVEKAVVQKTKTPPQKSLPLFIDLHGMTVEEATLLLDPYLDEAYYQGRETAHVIHGFGTGALRRGIHEHLQKHPAVESFELADTGQGGAGVTIVRLKKIK